MRVAVLADIHGNLPACEAVLQDIKRQNPDYIIAAGDLALRGPYPRETYDLLKSTCNELLLGNTDCYVSGNYVSGAYRDPEHWKTELLAWTRNELGSERVQALGHLKFSHRYSPRKGQDLFVCHANPKNLEESLEPTLDEHTVRKYLTNLDAAAVAFGHLHFPYRRRVGRTLIADVASAGIPRDGDLRPAWGLFTWTPRGWRVQIRRVRYPVRKTTQALHDRKVPGATLLIHKMLEARYRNHHQMAEAARKHAGMPPSTAPAQGPRPSVSAPRNHSLPAPPGIDSPAPGQSTAADEAADDLISPTNTLAPESTPLDTDGVDDRGPEMPAESPENDSSDV